MGGTGGAPGVCVPASVAPCYGGSPGTEGHGLCQAGSKACNAEGTAYGPCLGEVTPKPEDCASPVDEDCDGLAPACKGGFLWAKRFGAGGKQTYGQGVAADSSGNVVVVGNFAGTVDFAGSSLSSVGGSDVFVVKLDPSGSLVWNKRFGGPTSQHATGVAVVNGAGDVFVLGTFSGTVDFGGGPFIASGPQDIFVMKLDSTGAHVWSKHFGYPSGLQVAAGVAADSAGNVFITGTFSGPVDFGGGSIVAGGNGIFLAKFDAVGNHAWSKPFGGGLADVGASVAADQNGNVIVTGTFWGTADFGGVPITSAGKSDLFIAKFGGIGSHQWSKGFGSPGYDDGSSVAVDNDGNVLVAGSFSGTADFGGGPLISAGGQDIILAKFGAAGNHVWSRRYGDDLDQTGTGVAVDGDGNVLVTGALAGAVNFGGGPHASAGGSDVFLAKLDPLAAHQWSQRFGNASNQAGVSVCAGLGGNVIATGYFAGTSDFGGGSMTAAGVADGFVTAFTP